MGKGICRSEQTVNEFRRFDARLAGDGSVVIEEEASGSLTEDVYGVRQHSKSITIASGFLGEVAAMLCCEREEVAIAVRDLLSQDVCLVDIMDALDALEVPYSYVSRDGSQTSLRPAGECGL